MRMKPIAWIKRAQWKVSEEEREMFHCSQCTKSFTNQSNLLRHMKKDHDTFSCDICSQLFSKWAQLKKHNTQFCHHCMKHIGPQLKRHINSVHKDVRYSCDKCDKSFERQDTLQRHVKSEHQEIQYSCDKCDKSFNGPGNLQRHVKS